MIKALKVAQTLLIFLLLGVAFTSGAFVLGTTQGWWKVDVVLSGSMEPTLPIGSLVFATDKPTSDLAVGDVLMFKAPIGGTPKIIHRIVTIGNAKDGTTTIRTKGDNNDEADFWVARVLTPTSTVVDHHVPVLGYLVRSPVYVALIIAGLIALLTSLGLLQSALETDEEDPEPVEQGSPTFDRPPTTAALRSN